MCYALFIGSDESLTVLEGDELADASSFHLESLDADHTTVTQYFGKPHVYYAASWQGCGCGWFPDAMPIAFTERKRDEIRRETFDRTRRDLASLGRLLDDLLARTDSVELFLTWEGEQSNGPERRLTLAPADFDADALPLARGDFAVVARAGD